MTKEEIIQLDKNIYVIEPFKDLIIDKTRYSVLPKVDPFKESCLWPKPIVGSEAVNVIKVAEFKAKHTCGHPALFKPSIAEVLKYTPDDLIGNFNAITIEPIEYLNSENLHLSLVTAYKVDIIIDIQYQKRYFRHYKGNLYEYLGEATHSETLEDMVIYQAQYGEHKIWVRPKKMFFEDVILADGSVVKRFKEEL